MLGKLFGLIDRVTERLISNQQNRQAQNIKHELSLRALKSTVDYVESIMSNISSVDSKWKVHNYALQEMSLDGLFLEFGVFKGETINYIAKKTKNKVYGFDSFEGLPEFWRDGFDRNAFAIEALPQVEDNVVLIKGRFEETLPVFLDEKRDLPIAYLHVDCDLYSSTKTVFDNLEGRIRSGTVIVFDEYFNFPGWQHNEFKAFKEFIDRTGMSYKYITYNCLHEQVAVKII